MARGELVAKWHGHVGGCRSLADGDHGRGGGSSELVEPRLQGTKSGAVCGYAKLAKRLIFQG